MLCPPGGHINPSETPIQACQRELHEELGITVAPGDLEFLAVVARKTTEGETVGYEFVIRNKPYAVYNAEPDKCTELVWVDPTKLPADVVDDFKSIITQCLVRGMRYAETGY
jgi:8-oxo-dGTP pyrophosphatase MutT (NUDIX family)